jgi:soluble lytic murein transglycosylase-like protein
MQASPSRARAHRQKTTVATGTRSVDSLNTETQVPEKLKEVIAESARKYDIPEKLLSAVIKVESNFNPRAVSSEGARGLMQLMPATARQLGVKNSFDIQQNVDAGSRYLKDMLDRYDGRIDLALAAYNAGPGAVDRYGGIPPYRETKGYVKKVMAYC